MKKTQRILQLLDRIDELEKQLKEERENKIQAEPPFDFIEWLKSNGCIEETNEADVKYLVKHLADGTYIAITPEEKTNLFMAHKKNAGIGLRCLGSGFRFPKSETEAKGLFERLGIYLE